MKRAPRTFSVQDFLVDNNVPFLTEGHKHCQSGWIQIICPFCAGNPGWHLGFHLEDNYWNCWRCGFHSLYEIIETLSNDLQDSPGATLSRYSGRPKHRSTDPYHRAQGGSVCALPSGSGPLSRTAKQYLRGRGFGPVAMQKQWNIESTGPLGAYKHRIVIPIYIGGHLVSYQCRDITGKSELKYKACAIPKEVIHHKHILYGIDQVPFDTIVIVEGILDAWRLGPGAVATFGIKTTAQQVKLMLRYPRRIILFDNPAKDPQAGPEAEKLAAILSQKPGTTEIIDLHEWPDPGEMPVEEATKLMVSVGAR